MSIKFRLSSIVTITTIPSKQEYMITIGPVINRQKYGWSTFCCSLSPDINFDDVFNFCEKYNKIYTNDESDRSDKITFVIEYVTFKKYFTHFEVSEIYDRFTPLSDNDLLDDLDFIREEIINIHIQMNIMKQKGEIERYNFYDDLVSNKRYKMFQFVSQEQYDAYINRIRHIIAQEKDTYEQRINDIHNVSSKIWE